MSINTRTTTGVVWKHEGELLDMTTQVDDKRWIVGHVTAFVRVGDGEVTFRYPSQVDAPPIGTIVAVTLDKEQA